MGYSLGNHRLAVKVISFDSKICQNLEQALKQEWRETNQFGGFASSTIISANTRREHGLFIAQLSPPLAAHVFLNNVEETLFIDDLAYPLSTQLFANTVYPEGYKNLSEFSFNPFPTWIFRVEDLVIVKEVIFLYEEQSVIIRYRIAEGDQTLVRLELRPLAAFRDLHSLTHQSDRLNTQIETSPGRIRFAGFFFHHNAAILDRSPCWRTGLQYPEEKKAGLDFEEDLFSPFRLVYTFLKGQEVFLCASIQDRASINPDFMVLKEKDRRLKTS